MIYHIQVGDKKFTPTGEDLQKVVLEFQKDIPVFDVPIKITEIHLGPADTERLLIQINTATWSPTDVEKEELRQMFKAALQDPNGGVVSTRYDVTVTTVQPFFVKESIK